MEDNGILVVDDAPDIRELFRIVLEDAGYAVCTADDGQSALETLRLLAKAAILPKLILLDLSMPIMSGQAVLAALKADPRFASIPVIAVTASTVAKPGAANAILRKPVDPDALLTYVGAYCRPAGIPAERLG